MPLTETLIHRRKTQSTLFKPVCSLRLRNGDRIMASFNAALSAVADGLKASLAPEMGQLNDEDNECRKLLLLTPDQLKCESPEIQIMIAMLKAKRIKDISECLINMLIGKTISIPMQRSVNSPVHEDRSSAALLASYNKNDALSLRYADPKGTGVILMRTGCPETFIALSIHATTGEQADIVARVESELTKSGFHVCSPTPVPYPSA